MSPRRDRELGRRLAALRAPDEAEAERRSLELVRAAYAERTPVHPSPRNRRLALALAAGVLLLAIGLSPAGAKVADLVSDVVDSGQPDARPELRSLPAAGELLVQSPEGPWIVREDGSKRLLGDYDEATWSPHGVYVAVAEGRELAALDIDGDVRWTFPAPGRGQRPALGGRRRRHPDRLSQRRRSAGDRRRRQPGERPPDRPRRRPGAARLAADRLLEAGTARGGGFRADLPRLPAATSTRSTPTPGNRCRPSAPTASC